MFYYLYEIRNNLNGKIYVGVHKTKDMNDGYMGSGKVIRSAIGKHGIENFTKVILETFEDSVSMYAREAEVVTEEFLAREDVYNLRRGGHGGFDYINKFPELRNNATPESVSKGGRVSWERHRDKHTERLAAATKKSWNENYDKRKESNQKGLLAMRSAEVIQKRKEIYNEIKHQQGERNSQFGTMWITDGVKNKKIKKTDTIPDGWNRGRVDKK